MPQIVFDEDIASTIKAFSSLKDNGSFRQEMRLKTKTGKEVYVDLDAVALPTGKLIAFCEDITKQKTLFRALRNSEEKQRMYLENCGIPAFITNPQGKYEYVNEAACKLTGYSSNELYEMSVYQLIFREDLKEKMGNFDILKTQGSFRDELRLRCKNGNPVLVDLSAVKLPDQTLIAFCNDISERKKAEEELSQKYETLERVAQNVGAGLAIIGRDYNVIWANKTLMSLGVSPTKKCFQTFNHSTDVCPDCGVKKVFEQNLPLDVHEYKAVNSQGEVTWIELRVTPLKNRDGIITSALELAVPINERKKSEEKFKSLFEGMAQGGFWQKADGMLLDVNQSALDIFGISRKEFLDRTSESSSWLVIGEDGSNLSGSMHPSMVALRTGKPVNNFVAGIYNPIKKNYVWVSINAIPEFKEGETEPQEVFVTLHDITDLKTTRDALRVSELKYRELINGMSESVWVIDFEGNFLDINTAAYKSLGYSKEELLSLGIKGIDSNLTQDQVKGLINRLPTVGTQIFETIHTAKDGKQIPVEISSSLVAYQGKQAILSIARDITERKKIADDLQFNQKRFKQAQSVAHIGVWDLAVHSGVLVWSEETCKVLGFPIDIVPSVEKFLDRVHPSDLEFVKKSIDDALNKAKPYNIDMRIIRTDGKTVWANATGEVEYDTEGKATRFFGMFQDITDRKKSEEKQREDNQQIALMNEKLRVVGSLTRHDVGNKLMAAKTNLYLLKKRVGNNPELHKFIEGVNSAIDESNRLFEFSRLYEKIGSQKLSTVDVGACFDEATKMVANQNTLKITNQCRGTNVVADSLLTQLLYNLIENSLKHGEKVSKIKLYFEKAKNVNKLFYEDNGVGISQPNKAKLFSEGFTTGKGSGLGLKLIKRMIEVYGWSINEEGTPGEGAKFKITIPKLNQTKTTHPLSKTKKE